MPSSNDELPPKSFDARFTATTRCVVAVCVLLILTLGPLARPHYHGLTYLILGLYAAYSVLLYMAARWWRPLLPRVVEIWCDAGWAVGLMALSSDPSGILAEFAFIAILLTAIQWGLAPGLRIALVAATLILCVGVALAFDRSEVGFSQVLVGPVSLVVLSSITASFGGLELRLTRRLTLLKDITRLSNPRFGIDRTVGMVVEQLRAFYDADACLLIMPDPCRAGYQFRRADRQDPERAVRAEILPAALTHLLLALPERHAAIYGGRHRGWQSWSPKARVEVFDIKQGRRIPADVQLSDSLVTMLDAKAFITVPLASSSGTGGRLYLTAGRRGAFDQSDVDFLLQVFDHTLPALHNIQLVDQLAAEAADAERQRVALDLHDGVIQPYIGLQMGLEAIRQKLMWGHAEVTRDLECLLDLTKDEIAQLRHLVQSLKNGGERIGGLLPAIRRFALKFAAATGIQVHIEAKGESQVNDHLATEVFHIVTEGLSNIRRHTQAATASITLAQEKGYLILQIINDGVGRAAFCHFTPRSITERTIALGGRVRVERQGYAHTAVTVEIPLGERLHACN